MIYITGDCHADFRRLSMSNFPEQKEMTKEDYVIICGDFGGIWDYRGESEHEKYWLDWLAGKPFTTLFVDGNHENFSRLYQYPEKEWNGGHVHEIRPSVLHLMRGYIFNLQGKSFLTFGGARSHDISDGILDPVKDKDKIKKWNHDYTKMFRVNGVTWWEEEMPTVKEMDFGFENLEEHNWEVDFIVTHDCPSSTKALISMGAYKPDELSKYFEEIKEKCDFKKWVFGHYHENRMVNEREILLYEQIIRIA